MSASRVGKCRYNVPIPTPAFRAIASSVTSAPEPEERTLTAAASSRSRLRTASARNGRASVSLTERLSPTGGEVKLRLLLLDGHDTDREHTVRQIDDRRRGRRRTRPLR